MQGGNRGQSPGAGDLEADGGVLAQARGERIAGRATELGGFPGSGEVDARTDGVALPGSGDRAISQGESVNFLVRLEQLFLSLCLRVVPSNSAVA